MRHINYSYQQKTSENKALKSLYDSDVPTNAKLNSATMEEMDVILKERQLEWCGHAMRIRNDRLPKKILFGELETKKRLQGRSKLRLKFSIKRSLKDFEASCLRREV